MKSRSITATLLATLNLPLTAHAVDNLFDRDYQTATDYNQPGRGAYLTVRYQP